MLLSAASPVLAHPVPFSYLDIHLGATSVEGTLVLHDFDVAHEVALDTPDALLDAATLHLRAPYMARFISGSPFLPFSCCLF